MTVPEDPLPIPEHSRHRDTRTILLDTMARIKQAENEARRLEKEDPGSLQIGRLYKSRAGLVALTPFKLLNASDPIPTTSHDFMTFQSLAVDAIEKLAEPESNTNTSLEVFLIPIGLRTNEPNDFERAVYNLFPDLKPLGLSEQQTE